MFSKFEIGAIAPVVVAMLALGACNKPAPTASTLAANAIATPAVASTTTQPGPASTLAASSALSGSLTPVSLGDTESDAPAADTQVLVVNSTNHTLVNLYASGVDDPNYHGDWLGDRELEPGQSMVIDFNDGAGHCLMDVKGRFSDGDEVTNRYNVCTGYRMEFTGD